MSLRAREIAIVGLSCRYPGAQDARELWENILACRRQFRRIPDCRFPLDDYFDANARDKTYATRVGVMDWKDFDYAAHGISKATFEATDAVHWLALQVAMEAVADAGYTRENAPRARAGMILGNTLCGEQTRTSGIRLRWPFIARSIREAGKRSGMSESGIERVVREAETALKSVFPDLTEDSLPGSMSNTIVGRICSFFGFQGGGYVVDGACSSSLIAVATAADKLTHGELDLALAGGVDISLDPLEMIGFAGAHALTRGEMNVYDKRASGFIPGEGCGIIVLKRLEDAERDGDCIYAVIRGWGISSDGRGAIAAPNSIGQSKAILRAYEHAGYAPRDLNFIEGHGTGTPVGDRAELEAVYSAIRADRESGPSSCGITSLKTLVGHTKAAAGIGGLIKAAIAVNQRVLPPLAGCASPHVLFDVTTPRLYPLTQGEVRGADEKLRAGVSAMGFGGINCHITLESHAAPPSERLKPSIDTEQVLASAQETEVFLLGAESKAELIERLDALSSDALGASLADLIDLSASLARALQGQTPRYRAALVAPSPDVLVASIEKARGIIEESEGDTLDHVSVDRRIWLRASSSPARIGMVFPGQGSQQLNVGQVLVKRHAWARRLVESVDRWMGEIGAEPLSSKLFRYLPKARKEDVERWKTELTDTAVAQPAICLTSLLWARHLRALGVKPTAVAGHSLGELSAFAIAGAFDEEALIKLAAQRGRAMGQAGSKAGTMASLMCSRERAEGILAKVSGYVVVANINGPAQTVVSGEVEAVEAAIALAEAESIGARLLSVSNAFHSRLVENAAQLLRETAPVRGTPRALEATIVAGATGEPVAPDVELSSHFSEQVLAQVDFVSMIRTLAQSCELLIEVGPSRVLSGMANDVLGADGPLCLPIESAAGSDRDLNAVVAALFTFGHDLELSALFDGRLVRPFSSTRERAFFTNPCERPFAARVESENEIAKAIVATSWSKSLGVSPEMLQRYLDERGEVLTEVVRADLNLGALGGGTTLPTSFLPIPPTPELKVVSQAEVASAPTEELDEEEREKAATAVDPRESHPSALARQDDRIEKEIIKTLSERLEVPASLIFTSARLTDDLGLPLEDAMEVVEDIADISGVPDAIDAASFAHASIHDLACAVRAARRVRGSDRREVEPAKRKGAQESRRETEPRVRTIFSTLVERTPIARELAEVQRAAEDWASARVVLLANAGRQDPRVEALFSRLRGAGASVFVLPYSAAEGLDKNRFSHVYAFLPEHASEDLPADRVLGRSVDRLMAAARASFDATRLGRGKDNALVFVQFAGGTLLGRSRPVVAEDGVMSFAASLHLERPHHRVRVVDLAPSLPGDAVAELLMREVEAPGRWRATGYDETRTARTMTGVPSLELYARRAQQFKAGDVALVTCGAEGLTAECAISLAKATKMKVAIISRPDETEGLDPARAVEIQRNLARLDAEGVATRHYFASLTDGDAVRAVVDRIAQELGTVSLVIHGEGEREPMPIDRSARAKALAMLGSRVIGTANLIAALASHPLRLFTALTSSSGLTGLVGEGWCALGSEMTHALLRGLEAERGVETLAIAFDVWSPVGMGGRTGPVTEFNPFGLDAIPPAEGSRRFVELVTHDPGAKTVLITARPDALGTWTQEENDTDEISRTRNLSSGWSSDEALAVT